MQTTKRKINTQSGAAMLISVIFFLFISLSIIAGLVGVAVGEFRNSSMNLNSKKSYFLAESGGEDAAYRILNHLAISEEETITLDNHSVETVVTNLLSNTKKLTSLGRVVASERKVVVTLATGDGAVFKYGTQAGAGGFTFKNNAHVNGSLYSNGNIIGSNGAFINGDAYVAGDTGLIFNMDIGYNGTGDANAHTVVDSVVQGTPYCQIGSGNNKPCNTSRASPIEQDMPISEELITKWKADASVGQVINGDVVISLPRALGPVKINGNLIINNTLTLTDTIYVTGNIIINENKVVRLASSFATTSGIIVSDGYILIDNGVAFGNSGVSGSYLLLLSTSTCDESVSGSPCNGKNAIEVSNNSDISIVNAQQGTVVFSQNARVKEAVGYKIELKNGVGISYGTGIISVDFTSGPTGSWGIDSWEESE